MPIIASSHAACYGILIHSMEIDGVHVQWTRPSQPVPGTKVDRTESGWVRQPWRCLLQHGGLREQKVSFGMDKAQEFR